MARLRFMPVVVTFVKGPHLGSLAAIGLALWTGFLVVGPPVGLSEPNRWEYVVWVGLSAFVSAGYTVFRLTKENLSLKARFKPKVRIVHFTGKKPDYVREARMGKGVIERRHLVGVINDSGVKINDIRIVAERFEPYQQGATWAHAPLNPLRGTPNNSGWFDLTVGDGIPTQYVEVFQELSGVPGANEPILGCIYNSTGLNDLRRYMLGDWFAVVLRLEGDIPPCRFKLVAQRNVATRWFDVSEGDLDVQTMSETGGPSYQVVTLSIAPTEAPSPSQGG